MNPLIILPRKVFIFINGILNNPGSADGFTDRGVTWINTHTEHRAEKFEYFAGVLTRRFLQQRHALDLARLINQYHGASIVLVAHSNGCDLVCRALKWTNTKVSEIHFFSPATDSDFWKNGLNSALRNGTVGRVYVNVAAQDKAMQFARATGYVLKFIGLGYGTLGLSGPESVAPEVEARVICHREESFGHSTWFEDRHYPEVLKKIAA